MSLSPLPRPSWLRCSEALFTFVTFTFVLWSIYLVFVGTPNEKIMGPVQRVFYFHVGSAIACYCSFGLVLVGSLGYLATRKEWWDVVAEAAGEVGLIFCTIVLVSGMIWGHAIWNTAFRWEPRLVTFLLLWFVLLSFNILRWFADSAKVSAHCAVLGILGAITVPLMVYSIKFLPQSAQLHPQVVAKNGLDPAFKPAFFWSMGSLVLMQFLLTWHRFRLAILSRIKK